RGQRAGAMAELHATERDEVDGDQGGRHRTHHGKAGRQRRPPVQEEVSALSPGPRTAVRGLGILLIQLGTPDAPTPEALRPYLRQFLSDPRVIDVAPTWKWRFILRFFILRKRPAESAAKYQRIWDPVTGSPLLHWTKRQVALLQMRFDGVPVRFGMQVGNPPL